MSAALARQTLCTQNFPFLRTRSTPKRLTQIRTKAPSNGRLLLYLYQPSCVFHRTPHHTFDAQPPVRMNRTSLPALTPQQQQQLKLQQQQLLLDQAQKQQQQQQQLKFRSQPLGVSQLANIQAQREALAARVKISQRKSMLMEDDLEFCPQSPEQSPQIRPTLLKRATNVHMIPGSQGSLHGQLLSSPYSTPVKINPAHQQVLGQRMQQQQQGYISHSPQQLMTSPQHIYASPQGVMRRVDNIYGGAHSPARNW